MKTKKHRQTDAGSQVDRQAGRQASRQTDTCIQTDRQTNKQADSLLKKGYMFYV